MKLVGIMKLIIPVKWQKKEGIEGINQDKTVDDEIPNRSRSIVSHWKTIKQRIDYSYVTRTINLALGVLENV